MQQESSSASSSSSDEEKEIIAWQVPVESWELDLMKTEDEEYDLSSDDSKEKKTSSSRRPLNLSPTSASVVSTPSYSEEQEEDEEKSLSVDPSVLETISGGSDTDPEYRNTIQKARKLSYSTGLSYAEALRQVRKEENSAIVSPAPATPTSAPSSGMRIVRKRMSVNDLVKQLPRSIFYDHGRRRKSSMPGKIISSSSDDEEDEEEYETNAVARRRGNAPLASSSSLSLSSEEDESEGFDMSRAPSPGPLSENEVRDSLLEGFPPLRTHRRRAWRGLHPNIKKEEEEEFDEALQSFSENSHQQGTEENPITIDGPYKDETEGGPIQLTSPLTYYGTNPNEISSLLECIPDSSSGDIYTSGIMDAAYRARADNYKALRSIHHVGWRNLMTASALLYGNSETRKPLVSTNTYLFLHYLLLHRELVKALNPENKNYTLDNALTSRNVQIIINDILLHIIKMTSLRFINGDTQYTQYATAALRILSYGNRLSDEPTDRIGMWPLYNLTVDMNIAQITYRFKMKDGTLKRLLTERDTYRLDSKSGGSVVPFVLYHEASENQLYYLLLSWSAYFGKESKKKSLQKILSYYDPNKAVKERWRKSHAQLPLAIYHDILHAPSFCQSRVFLRKTVDSTNREVEKVAEILRKQLFNWKPNTPLGGSDLRGYRNFWVDCLISLLWGRFTVKSLLHHGTEKYQYYIAILGWVCEHALRAIVCALSLPIEVGDEHIRFIVGTLSILMTNAVHLNKSGTVEIVPDAETIKGLRSKEEYKTKFVNLVCFLQNESRWASARLDDVNRYKKLFTQAVESNFFLLDEELLPFHKNFFQISVLSSTPSAISSKRLVFGSEGTLLFSNFISGECKQLVSHFSTLILNSQNIQFSGEGTESQVSMYKFLRSTVTRTPGEMYKIELPASDFVEEKDEEDDEKKVGCVMSMHVEGHLRMEDDLSQQVKNSIGGDIKKKGKQKEKKRKRRSKTTETSLSTSYDPYDMLDLRSGITDEELRNTFGDIELPVYVPERKGSAPAAPLEDESYPYIDTVNPNSDTSKYHAGIFDDIESLPDFPSLSDDSTNPDLQHGGNAQDILKKPIPTVHFVSDEQLMQYQRDGQANVSITADGVYNVFGSHVFNSHDLAMTIKPDTVVLSDLPSLTSVAALGGINNVSLKNLPALATLQGIENAITMFITNLALIRELPGYMPRIQFVVAKNMPILENVDGVNSAYRVVFQNCPLFSNRSIATLGFVHFGVKLVSLHNVSDIRPLRIVPSVYLEDLPLVVSLSPLQKCRWVEWYNMPGFTDGLPQVGHVSNGININWEQQIRDMISSGNAGFREPPLQQTSVQARICGKVTKQKRKNKKNKNKKKSSKVKSKKPSGSENGEKIPSSSSSSSSSTATTSSKRETCETVVYKKHHNMRHDNLIVKLNLLGGGRPENIDLIGVDKYLELLQLSIKHILPPSMSSGRRVFGTFASEPRHSLFGKHFLVVTSMCITVASDLHTNLLDLFEKEAISWEIKKGEQYSYNDSYSEAYTGYGVTIQPFNPQFRETNYSSVEPLPLVVSLIVHGDVKRTKKTLVGPLLFQLVSISTIYKEVHSTYSFAVNQTTGKIEDTPKDFQRILQARVVVLPK